MFKPGKHPTGWLFFGHWSLSILWSLANCALAICSDNPVTCLDSQLSCPRRNSVEPPHKNLSPKTGTALAIKRRPARTRRSRPEKLMKKQAQISRNRGESTGTGELKRALRIEILFDEKSDFFLAISVRGPLNNRHPRITISSEVLPHLAAGSEEWQSPSPPTL